LRLLQRDNRRVNRGVALLDKTTREEHWYQYLRAEVRRANSYDPVDGPAFVPSPETDRYAPAAASRFFVHEDSDELVHSALVHDDTELQADAITAGDGFRATITDVRDECTSGRGLSPVWVLEGDG